MPVNARLLTPFCKVENKSLLYESLELLPVNLLNLWTNCAISEI